ncbi:mitochondrial intermembrane space import and assembly protein 40-like [Bolinopsis microptera]|uniref:mitochondrial intermembrane space import and assembly protein 40-like n=1 Tax=Bolinopsis microptera TaxID=2820187 RepID=UPI003078B554
MAQGGPVSEEVQEQYPGAVSESGRDKLTVPCLGGMGTEGPCVEEFRSAFSCWMFSPADEQGGERGDDCVDNFFAMSNCMQQNEEFYDDLNARNKAAAEEALSKYEAEEQEKLAAVEEELKALENTESETPVVLPAVTETESETKVEKYILHVRL